MPRKGPKSDAGNHVLSWARRYLRAGWSIIPLKPNSKEPAIPRWKPFQARPPDESEVRDWLAEGERGIAVVLGDVSGGLAVRDFDAVGAYEHWRDDHSALARELPTVKTGRGLHVYAKSHHLRFRKLEDGEWRGEGHYVAAPPSVHPRGRPYEWVVKPPGRGIDLIVDPVKAGLVPAETRVAAPAEAPAPPRTALIARLNWSTIQFIERGAPIGTRNRTLFNAACDLASHNFPPRIAFEWLLQGYRRCEQDPEHPLDESEARRTILSAFSEERHGPIKRPHPLDAVGVFGVQRLTGNGNDTLVWGYLAFITSMHGDCFPEQKTMAEALGICRSTIGDSIKRLEKLGLLTVHRRKVGSNHYELLLPPGAFEDD